MRLHILSGAGLSAESGIPTFRTGANATWEGHSIKEVCSHETWRDNFNKVHAFYNQRRSNLAEVVPNAAHAMIAKWQSTYETVIMTTNVDDLLERAGCVNVLHMHGSLKQMVCEARGPGHAKNAKGCGHVWDIGYANFNPGHDSCPGCGSKDDCKPAVVFFGEYPAEYEVYWRNLKKVQRSDVFLVIGMSGAVWLNGCAVDYAVNRLSCLKILNNLEPNIDYMNHKVFKYHLFEPATTGVERIDGIIKNHFEKVNGR